MKALRCARVALAAALVLGTALAITGCADPATEPVSAKERMEMFRDDVNDQKLGNLTRHLHSDVGGAPDAAFWETYFDGVTNFSFTIVGTTAAATCSTGAYTFTLAQDEATVYKITDITRNGSSILTDY